MFKMKSFIILFVMSFYISAYTDNSITLYNKLDQSTQRLYQDYDQIAVKFISEFTHEQYQAFATKHDLNITELVSHRYKFCVYSTGNAGINSSVLDSIRSDSDVLNVLATFFDEQNHRLYIDPELLVVRFEKNVNFDEIEIFLKHLNCKIIESFYTYGLFIITKIEGLSVFKSIDYFNNQMIIRYAYPKYYSTHTLASDSYLNDSWHLKNTGQEPEYVVNHDLNVFPAWDITFGDPDVIVVVIDSGIEHDHPDLNSNILPRGNEDWDFTDRENKEPIDVNSHGTLVSGVAVAVMN